MLWSDPVQTPVQDERTPLPARKITEVDEDMQQGLRATFEAAKTARKLTISNSLRCASMLAYLSGYTMMRRNAHLASNLRSNSKNGPRALRILLMWSVSYNFDRLLAPAPADSLKCLNGIRVLSMMVVVLGMYKERKEVA